MTLAVLSISRRHVLGTLHSRCEAIAGSVPVYLEGAEHELLGYADESLGHYADAFSFHLDTDYCKRLASGQFTYDIEFDHAEAHAEGDRGRIRLSSITLVKPKTYEKPIKAGRTVAEGPEASK